VLSSIVPRARHVFAAFGDRDPCHGESDERIEPPRADGGVRDQPDQDRGEIGAQQVPDCLQIRPVCALAV